MSDTQGMKSTVQPDESLTEILKTMNNNVARLTISVIALTEEVNLIRRSIPHAYGSYDVPYGSALNHFKTLAHDSGPVILE